MPGFPLEISMGTRLKCSVRSLAAAGNVAAMLGTMDVKGSRLCSCSCACRPSPNVNAWARYSEVMNESASCRSCVHAHLNAACASWSLHCRQMWCRTSAGSCSRPLCCAGPAVASMHVARKTICIAIAVRLIQAGKQDGPGIKGGGQDRART